MRPEKTSITEELRRRVDESDYLIVADYRGLDVAKTEDLRRRLGAVKARYRIVSNRLFHHAAPDLSGKGFKAALRGPSALVSGCGDVIPAAKVLKEFIKENSLPLIKIGALQGAVLSPNDLDVLASLPSREVLLAKMVGTLAAPLSQLVGVFHQKVASLLYVLKAVQEKKAKA